MNETEDIEDEWENPYSVYTTAGLSYKAMRMELGKKKVTVKISDEEDVESLEHPDRIIPSASGKRSKKLPKSKLNPPVDASQISVNEAVEKSSNVEKENLDTVSARVTRRTTRQRNQSVTSNCESNNHINTDAQPATTRRGRRAQNPRNVRNNNNNISVLNAEPIVIPDSPTVLPMVSDSVPPASRVPLTTQDDPIELSDDSDVEANNPVFKNLEISLTEDDNCEIPVRVWWKFGKIDKFNIRKYQKLVSIFQHYSKQENVAEENILLMLKNVKIQQNDTPDSVGLVPGMIIEGGVCGNCSSATAASSSKVAEPAPNKDGIELRIQQKGKKVPLTLTINKTQKMKVLMLKCAEQLDIPVEKLKLYFDGEPVSADDTPEDLDLEGDECMDLHVLQ